METIDVIKSRRSVRKFEKGYKINEDILKEILTCAMMAPSAMNKRPWKYYVISNDEIKNKIADSHPHASHIKDASVAIVVSAKTSDETELESSFIPQDCAAATQNILLSAHDLGLSACWCGLYPRLSRCKEIAKIINCKEIPVSLIIIGKGAETPEARGYYDDDAVSFV